MHHYRLAFMVVRQWGACGFTMSWFNDGRFTGAELKNLGFLLGMGLFIVLFLHVVYRFAFRKAKGIVGIAEESPF